MSRKRLILPVLALCLLVGYCALPLTSVATITLTLVDQLGGEVAPPARAVFLDAEGREIVSVDLGALPSRGNNIHWWSHSSAESSLLRPDDARRVRSARVGANVCSTEEVPVQVVGSYVPLSFSLHGGGRAYMLYEFAGTVRLNCAMP